MLTQRSERRRLRTLMAAPRCLWTHLKTAFHHFCPCISWRDGTVCANWKRGRKIWDFISLSAFVFVLFFMTTSKLRSIYSPFVFSVIYVLWLSKLPTLQADIRSFTYFRTRFHQPVNRFLSAFSHCLGRVNTGWLISPCPLFSSCISGIQWDWCPSDHLCIAQELDVLGSVCGSQQLLHHCL